VRWATAVQCLPPTTVYRYCSLKNNVLWTKKGQSCEAAAMWWSGFVFSFSAYTNPISEIREQIERLFSDFPEETRMPMLRDWPTTGTKATTWLPPIEVTESDKELMVCASLPGMKPENINVDVVGHTLVISGESRRESKVDEKHFHRSEFQYGQFMRRVPLPEYVKGEECQATFNSGVLEVHLPKTEVCQSKKIEVKTGQ
jgi:HSP20 family protein